jgi:hypothetical protein
MTRVCFQFSIRTMAAVVALLSIILLWANYTVPWIVILAGPLLDSTCVASLRPARMFLD